MKQENQIEHDAMKQGQGGSTTMQIQEIDIKISAGYLLNRCICCRKKLEQGDKVAKVAEEAQTKTQLYMCAECDFNTTLEKIEEMSKNRELFNKVVKEQEEAREEALESGFSVNY